MCSEQHDAKGVCMKSRFPRAMAYWLIIAVFAGCSSQFATTDRNDAAKVSETTKRSESVSADTDLSLVEEPAHATYPEEEATLSSILQLYEDALSAIENDDFELAETKIDSAAVLSAEIDIEAIQDSVLAMRYTDTLSTLFQQYGRMYRSVDTVNQDDPLKWLEELSETDPQNFKNGLWKDDELRQIVQKIALRSDVPIDYNEQVRKSIYFFQIAKKKEMERWQRRSGRFIPFIQEVFEEEGIPLDIAYLAMIESGMNTRAYSRAHASGLWQFIYSTGRLYGLKRTQWLDERRDAVKSTRAAARHLKDLYSIYGDWRLVMAAYNCGPTRITRQFRAGNTDYWTMSMPRETAGYVPSFMAAVVISKAPELFGFEGIEYEAPLEFDTVDVPYMKLSVAAECTGAQLQEILDLNTELLREYTPADGLYPLKIPKGTKDRFVVEFAKIPKEKYQPPRTDTYIVKSGDTLSGIASRFRVSVNAMIAANSIRNPSRLSVGQRLNIPGSAVSPSTVAASGTSSTAKAVPETPVTKEQVAAQKINSKKYTVKRNDSLWLIARRHNTTIAMLTALNNITGTKIVPGQTILVPAEAATLATADPVVSGTVANSQSADSADIVYTIQRNDTLYEIAKKYGVSHQDIMQWNKIKNHRTIKPGQKIIIKKR